ncbi:MAG: hypothetical protein M1820_008828 [Bogoriella megaspora]|nr:MAG: hypothetical protein M1820_008828 [Bogoriella megaspora]
MASLSTSSPHAQKAHPFPPPDAMAVNANINGDANSDSISINQSAYQDNSMNSVPAVNGDGTSLNGTLSPDGTLDPAPAPAGLTPATTIPEPSQSLPSPTMTAPVDLSASTLPPKIEAPISDERAAPPTTTQASDLSPTTAAQQTATPTTEESTASALMNDTQPEAATTSQLESSGAGADASVATTEEAESSGMPVVPESQPVADLTSNETKTGTEEDVIMTDAQTDQEVATKAAEDSAMQETGNISDSSLSGKVHPREDEDAQEEPASKRAKTEGSEAAAPEFKVPEVPQPTSPSEQSTATAQQVAPLLESSAPNADSKPMTDAQRKSLLDIIKNVKKVKAAIPFLDPVDPIRMNLPRYAEIVPNPMDLGTMDSKLKNSQYTTVADFVADFDLMIRNCVNFNGPNHPVSANGLSLKAYFTKVVHKVPSRDEPEAQQTAKKAKKPPIQRSTSDAPSRRTSRAPAQPPTVKPNDPYALGPDGVPLIRRDSTAGDRPKREIHRPPPKDLPYSTAKPKRKKYQHELRFVEHVVAEMNKAKYAKDSWPFMVAVDPVALNIPTYFSVIKKPMDFGTITQKLKHNEYESAKEFKADVDLMFDNCYRFNPPEHTIHQHGKAWQETFKKIWDQKDEWIEQNARSGVQSPADDADSEVDDGDDEEGDEEDDRVAKLRQIQEQIQALSQQAAAVFGSSNKKPSPKAPSRKNSSKVTKPASKPGRKSGGTTTSSSKAVPKPAPKKEKKSKPLSADEKAEIQEKVERFMDEYSSRAIELVRIIKDNDPKFANLPEDEIELDLEDLEVFVARMLLNHLRKYFPKAPEQMIDDEDMYDEPERRAAKNASSTSRRKNKPMTKDQQEADIATVRAKLEGYGNPAAGSPGEQSEDFNTPKKEENSDDDSGSESEAE